MFKKFPDTIATFLFLPAGLSFGYLFFLPWIDGILYESVIFWPWFAMLFSVVLTASAITIIKLNKGKYVFEHFNYMTAASVAYIVAGILFVVLREENTSIALFIVSIANGVVYVAGFSYVNIRTEKKERPSRFATCHAWKMLGFVTVLTLYLYVLESRDGSSATHIRNQFYQIIGYILVGTSVMFIFLMVVNEIRQRQGLLYNYKDCLDHDNAIANNYCKLFSRNEVIIERNPTVSSAGLWKSTENLLPRSKQNYTNLWTIYLMLPKLHGAVMFHYLLLMFTLHESDSYIDWHYSSGITAWIMAFGAVVGIVCLRFAQSGNVYTTASTVATVAIGVSYAFFGKENGTITIFLWIYFLAVSVATAIPDLALMEISKIRFSEGAFALGQFVEIVTIAVLQYTQRSAFYWTTNEDYNEKYFLPTIVSTVVVLVVTSVLYQLHMPNTYDKSLLQIQNELLKYKKYFVFTFDEDVLAPAPRRTLSESTQYMESNAYSRSNVFEEHAKTLNGSNPPSEYMEVAEKLPDPPTNRATNFDYSTDIPKAPAIIPRVNLAKSKQPSFNPYSNQQN